MDDTVIGQWVRRARRRTKWHLADSVVNGAVITRCGKTMRRHTIDRGTLETSEVMPLTRMIDQPQLCKTCQ